MIQNLKKLDDVIVSFDSNDTWIFNIVIALVMFGVALGITKEDFKNLLNKPKILLSGLFAQLLIFPLVTFLLIIIINPPPSVALGMILIASSPGGNVSIFLTQLSGGNSAFSISLTAFMTLFAGFFTPFCLSFLGNLYEPTSGILKEIQLDHYKLMKLVILTLGVPLIIGMFINHYWKGLANKISKILKPISLLIFIGFIIVVVKNNFDVFINYIKYVILIVIVHNLTGMMSGFYFGKLMKLSLPYQKTLAFELAIPNVGLALLLVFAFFNGLGGMALCVGFWAVWNVISGILLSFYWKKKSQKMINV